MKEESATNLAGPVQTGRPRLLVSVRDVDEAQAVLEGGADWIDLKEPADGPLGAVGKTKAQEVVEYVAGRRPVSAALGEFIAWQTSAIQELLELPGIEYMKLGLAGCVNLEGWSTQWLAAERTVRQAEKSLVAVVYADWQTASSPHPELIVKLAQQSSCKYLLIDTFDKSAAGTLGCLGQTGLCRLLRIAKQAALRTVVAGGFTLTDLPQLGTAPVDMIAVRGAVCKGDRRGRVDTRLVAQFCKALPAVCPN